MVKEYNSLLIMVMGMAIGMEMMILCHDGENADRRK